LHVVVRRFSAGSVTCAWRVPPTSPPIKATLFVSAPAAGSAHATVAVAPR